MVEVQDRPIDIKKMDFSFFGKGANLKGIFSLVGTTHLSAHLDGEVIVRDGGRFIIEDEGCLEGTLRGHDVDIFGTFEGTLKASGRVVIHSTAQVSGDIVAKGLVVKPNSQVNVKAHTEDSPDGGLPKE